MRTTTIIRVSIAALASLFILSACSESDAADTTKPVINLIEPADNDTLRIGADVHLEMELSDDVMLGSYKIEIHNNFNDHTHGTKTVAEEMPFAFNRSWDLTGKRNATIHHHEIVIPENAQPGKYHLMVYCTDEAGNESYAARSIVLSHEGGEDHDHAE